MFLHRILNKPEHTLSKKILLEQQHLPGNNWLETTRTHMNEIQIQCKLEEIEKMSKYTWKKQVEEALLKKEQ